MSSSAPNQACFLYTHPKLGAYLPRLEPQVHLSILSEDRREVLMDCNM